MRKAGRTRVRAAQAKRWIESGIWFFLVFAIPNNVNILGILVPRIWRPLVAERTLILVALAACAVIAAWLDRRGKRLAIATCAVAMILPFFLLPPVSDLQDNHNLRIPGLEEVAAWAQSSTPRDAVFLFPDAGKSAWPGIFRADALRAVYVDWKGGGQISFFRSLAAEWWSRWQDTMAQPCTPERLPHYQGLGIDYVVLRREAGGLAGAAPLFESVGFRVYPTGGQRSR